MFLLGVLAIYRCGGDLWSTTRPALIRWIGLLLMAWVIALLVQSIATVSFTGPPVFAASFGLAGLVAACHRTQEGTHGADVARDVRKDQVLDEGRRALHARYIAGGPL